MNNERNLEIFKQYLDLLTTEERHTLKTENFGYLMDLHRAFKVPMKEIHDIVREK